MTSRIKPAARMLFNRGGGARLLRLRYRGGARILMYHNFSAANLLEDQCAHLRKYYRPISLTELGRMLECSKTIPSDCLVCTVDDGYRDFYQYAYPVFKAYSIPVIVYLATDMLDRQTCLWNHWVGVLFSACQEREVELPLAGRAVKFSLLSDGERNTAALHVKETLKRVSNSEKLRLLEQLPELLQLAEVPSLPERWKPLRWEEVREMAAHGIEFGAHTKSHPILSSLENRDEIRGELAGSKARIESETGNPSDHFCYPNGTFRDFTPEAVEIARECGFLTAVTGEWGMNFGGSDRFRLRRISVEPDMPQSRFELRAAGWRR